MLTLFIRTIIIYFALLLALRLMGKRQIGELRVSELIITLILSEIAVQPITDRNKPLLYAIVPILLLLSVEVIVSYLLLKSDFIKKLFYGSPTILIRRGRLLEEELKKNRIEADELASELRQKGFSKLDEIYYAVLEENGKLDTLPDELKETARVRMENEQLSLADLGALLTPPVTKSGVRHRLDKILYYAQSEK